MFIYNPTSEALLTRDALGKVPTPPPSGPYHQPVGFGEFVELVENRLDRAGVQINEQQYAVRHDGMRFFGLMDVSLEGVSGTDWSMKLGLRGSHDKIIPRGLTFGSHVLVCSNLCFHGDLGTLQTRQTTKVWDRLPRLVGEAVSRLPEMAKANVRRFDSYRTTKISENDGDLALVEMHRKNILTTGQLGTALKEWVEPTYAEHDEDGATVWRLFNATTESLKPANGHGVLATVQTRSLQVSDFMDDLVVAA